MLFHFMPIEANLWIGRRLGAAAFFVNRKRRMIAYANLKAAFAREKSPRELRAITKNVYIRMVESFAEIAGLTKVSRAYVNRYVEVVNMERIENAGKSGRGTILLTAHFGDWELSSLVSAMKGFPITVLAREQKMKRLNELLNALRESKGCKVVRKGLSTKLIFRELYKKSMVGVLSDQDAGRSGTFIEFFGRPTSAHIGPFEIAEHTDSIILPNFIVRQRGPYHKLYLEDYIETKSAGKDGLKACLQTYMSLLEKYVRQYPEQWLWLHKRWKSTPKRTVLVLNDSRPGHLNQSMAVARQIQRARTTQGYKIEDTSIEVVDVEYKNRFTRFLLSALAPFASWRCHGRMHALRLCLKKDSYEKLMRTYAEFVVSCGSSLAPVNIYMKKENNAKSVVVMRPGVLFAVRKFDAIIVPRHDKLRPRKNVVETTLAPNLVNEDVLRLAGERLKTRIRPAGSRTVGLLIGGDNPEFRLSEKILRTVVGDLLKSCDSNDADLLVTTSRRTGTEQENVLKALLKDHPRCKLLVIANNDNPPGTLTGILALSDIVVVSGESISMVSEAVSSGKRTIAFALDKKTGGVSKHERVLANLEAEGLISIARSGELISQAGRALKFPAHLKKINDTDKIYEAMRALI
jgi:KDO2-lipid IV(A) lauroyltransferase